MPNDWYPQSFAARISWHANFAAQAASSGTTHGLTAAQVTQIGIDATNVALILNGGETVDAFRQAYTEYKHIILEGDLNAPLPPSPDPPAKVSPGAGSLPSIEARTRQYAAIVRASVGYTPEIGEQYGIISPVAGAPGDVSITAFALTASQVRCVAVKAGFDAVAIDSRRGGGAWEQIGVAILAEFIDSRAPLVAGQPEVREFRGQGMSGNTRTGALSGIVSVVTVP